MEQSKFATAPYLAVYGRYPTLERFPSSWPDQDHAAEDSRPVGVEVSGKYPIRARSLSHTLIRRILKEVAGLDQSQVEGTREVFQKNCEG